MAIRHILHVNHLDLLKKWLIENGWVIEEVKGQWEVLRARKAERKHPLIVYKKQDAKEHLTIMERDKDVIYAFLKEFKDSVLA